jgi:hypothetical protein
MDNRRALPRYSVQIEGKLMAPDMSFCVDVMINDLSEGGALISALAPADLVPDRAYLWEAQTRTLFECTVRWRKNHRLLGLQFTEASTRERRRKLIDAATPSGRKPQLRGRAPRPLMHRADNAA